MSEQKKQLTPLMGVIILVAAYLIGNIISFAVALFMAEGDARTFIMYSVPQICSIATILVGFKILNLNFLQTLPIKRKLALVPTVVSPLLTVSTMAMSMVLLYSFTYLTRLMGIAGSVAIPAWNSAVNVIFGIICLSVLPAIGEEFLFRGMLLKSFAPLGGRAAILLSALVFSVQHMSTAQLVHQFILGALLAYIVLKTDNIWYAVIIHFLNNLAAQLLNLSDGLNQFLGTYAGLNFGVLFAVSAVGAALTLGLLFLLKKSVKGGFSLQKREQLQRIDIYAVAGAVALYLILWIAMAVAL